MTYVGRDGVTTYAAPALVGVGGVAREISHGFVGISGVMRQFLGPLEGLSSVEIQIYGAYLWRYNNPGDANDNSTTYEKILSLSEISQYGNFTLSGNQMQIQTKTAGKYMSIEAYIWMVFSDGKRISINNLRYLDYDSISIPFQYYIGFSTSGSYQCTVADWSYNGYVNGSASGSAAVSSYNSTYYVFLGTGVKTGSGTNTTRVTFASHATYNGKTVPINVTSTIT